MAMKPEAPLLFFDSGIGGLSVVGPSRALLPNAPIVYVADNAGFPYGTKSEAAIAARVPALLGRLVERYRPRLVVIACNTASTIALDAVRGALDVPVVGTVPAVRPAARLSRTRVIGVLGTDATVRQPYVDQLSTDFAADCTVVRHGSATLVELAEAKLRGEAVDSAIVAHAVAPLFAAAGAAIDTVVLACTHFPLLANELAIACPPGVRFVDGSAGIARRIVALTQGQDWPGTPASRAIFTRQDDAIEALRPALDAAGFDAIDLL